MSLGYRPYYSWHTACFLLPASSLMVSRVIRGPPQKGQDAVFSALGSDRSASWDSKHGATTAVVCPCLLSSDGHRARDASYAACSTSHPARETACFKPFLPSRPITRSCHTRT
ncbi:hypothetical protein ACRALDRAFT_2057377 [Sodiomyces alcalophilus JCM 7366]|uniref:uncharacterized protein n=1 Tax=Sodiomyces alcalophilus JCM 7366 TaxID=591952 RepID=UPI0039B5C1CE